METHFALRDDDRFAHPILAFTDLFNNQGSIRESRERNTSLFVRRPNELVFHFLTPSLHKSNRQRDGGQVGISHLSPRITRRVVPWRTAGLPSAPRPTCSHPSRPPGPSSA